MGRVINSRLLIAKELLQLPSPVILCTNRPDLEKTIAENGYQTISLNLPLAKLLEGLDLREISSIITDRVRACFPQTGSVYLTGYEMLFDPRYEINVLRLFVDLARYNKLIIKWLGKANGATLTYAEQGYPDYKRYKISDYDVTIVK